MPNFSHFILTFVLVLAAATHHSPLQANPLDQCSVLHLHQTYHSVEDLIRGETTIPTHPWQLRIATSILNHQSTNQVRVVNPLVTLKGNDGTISYPVSKIEPASQQVMMFGHLSTENDSFSFYPEVSPRESITQAYPHPLPHPGIMDHFKAQVLTQLFSSYRQQNLPAEAWHTMILDEFSLARHRTLEISLSHHHQLRANARLYIGDRKLGVERQLFAENPVTSQLYSAGLAAGSYSAHETPIERLLKRFGIEENPIEQLRQSFPDFSIVEVGRLFIPKEGSPSDRKTAKDLLLSAIVKNLKEIAPEQSLAKVLVVASSGPFGARRYPSEFGMSKLFETELNHQTLIPTIPEGVAEIMGMPTLIHWVPHLKDIEESMANDVDFKSITIFATTGDVLMNTLERNGIFKNEFPEHDRLPYITYDSVLDAQP